MEIVVQDRPFNEIAVILLLALVLAAFGFRFRQPLIISFLAAGILIGPSGLRLINDPAEIELLAHIGIALLLFVVGLRLDIGTIRTVGPVALATGIGQVLFTSLIGFILALGFGMSVVPALYVSVALAFSSTIIIVKLLSDKKEIDSLHGRIAIGFLIVQDIVAILALIGLTAFGTGADNDFAARAIGVIGKGVGLLACVFVLMRWVFPRFLTYLARSQELLVLFAIAWAIALATGAEALGFSKEVGAFLAGVSLASTDQRDAIGARLVVLRDFLLLFFFIDLGARLNLDALKGELRVASIFSLFVLVGNPLIVMAIMGVMGYRRRTGLMCGLAVAQISEFSLIVVALGVTLGHIESDTMSLVTLVGLVTIFVSTYLILYSGPIYARLSPWLRVFERKTPYREQQEQVPIDARDEEHLILIGLGNYGGEIAHHLQRRGRKVLALDFDPQALERGRTRGLRVVYGDAGDPEVLSQLPLARAQWVVSTVRDPALNLALLEHLKSISFTGRVAAAAGSPHQAEQLRAAGAHVVLQPFSDAAEQAADIFTSAMQALPGLVSWPAVLQEVPLPTGSVYAGKTLRETALRTAIGITVLAVSRAGKVHFNPSPDLRLFPGDRLVLLGAPENVHRGSELLGEREEGLSPSRESAFCAAELTVSTESSYAGKTLAELRLREEHGVTVIGISRGEQRIHSPSGAETIEPGDRLVVVGSREAVERIKTRSPL